jgi:hypothetical protein
MREEGVQGNHRPHRKTTARTHVSRHREPAYYAEMPHVDETTTRARRWRQGPLTSRQGHAQTRCPRTRLLCPHRSRSVSHLVVLFLGLSALLTQSESSCPPGLAPNGGTCKNCPPGSFKSVEGTAPCQQCAANTFSSGERVEDLLRAIASGGGGTVLTVTASEFGSTVSVSNHARPPPLCCVFARISRLHGMGTGSCVLA